MEKYPLERYPHGTLIEMNLKNPDYKDEWPILEKMLERYSKLNELCLKTECKNEEGVIKIVEYINDYLNWSHWDHYMIKKTRRGLFSSIGEEFPFYLFKDIIKPPLYSGKSNLLTGINLGVYPDIMTAKSIEEAIVIDTTSGDYAIGPLFPYLIRGKQFILPFVVIESKRYADKPMRDKHEHIIPKIKTISPDCLYIIITDRAKAFIDKDFKLSRSNLDEIYIVKEDHLKMNEFLRADTVLKIFKRVKNHLTEIITESISYDDCLKRGHF